jgi:hypothetical protein
MRVYLAGPMTGYPEHNFPAFHAAAKAWRAKGHWVFNPAEQHDGDVTLPIEVYWRNDVHMILQVDALALLPGWEHSNYGKREILLAQGLGHNFFDAVTFHAIAPRVDTVAHPLVRQAVA